jgi:uncharacterized protein (DUF1800 family)
MGVADETLIAHLLRRTTFGPAPGQVERLAATGGIASAIDGVLAAPPLPLGRPPKLPKEGDGGALAKWWLARMANPGAGLLEKLTWFWHGHLTTSDNKVDRPRLLWQQHRLLREQAAGSFPDLVRHITVDPAMLLYLDGDGSTGDAPNENYGRELMELFTLGRGNYSQADVTAAARGLAGWSVDDRDRPTFDEGNAYQDPITFLGVSGRLRAPDIASIACGHSACSRFIVTKLHRYLVGAPPEPQRMAQLADLFRDSGLSIRPVVEDILRHPSFLHERLTRPRQPVEWVTAAMAALGLRDPQVAVDTCAAMGQVPFSPPNVAGWPQGNRWLGASLALAKAGLIVNGVPADDVVSAADPVDAALRRCALYEVTESTRAALEQAAATLNDARQRAVLLVALAVASPEFALA